jgi:hypothetical protein
MAMHLPVSWNVPKEFQPTIQPLVGYMIKLCPGWVRQITVYFVTNQDQGEHCRATMDADYKYRRVVLKIYPPFLDDNAEEQKRTIVHEALHILLAPLQNFVVDTFEAVLKDNPKVLELVKVNWHSANEAVTEDLTTMTIDSAGWGPIELEDPGSDEEEALIKPFGEKK